MIGAEIAYGNGVTVIGRRRVMPMIVAAGGLRAIRTRRFSLHLGRNAVHYAAQFLWFLAITLIPIAEVFIREAQSRLLTRV